MSGASAQPGRNDNASDNATWLFIRPSPYFHNSESWWSALFSILVLHLARADNPKIPLRKCVGSPKESFNFLGEYLDCSDVKFDEVLVDAKLTQRLFPGIAWPNEFRDTRPDIMIHRPKLKRITLIENKTVGANLGEQLDRYYEVKEHLSKEGWSVEFFLLISSGYENRREWRAVEKTETKLILWEDVLRIMDSTDFFRPIIGASLEPYYKKWA